MRVERTRSSSNLDTALKQATDDFEVTLTLFGQR